MSRSKLFLNKMVEEADNTTPKALQIYKYMVIHRLAYLGDSTEQKILARARKVLWKWYQTTRKSQEAKKVEGLWYNSLPPTRIILKKELGERETRQATNLGLYLMAQEGGCLHFVYLPAVFDSWFEITNLSKNGHPKNGCPKIETQLKPHTEDLKYWGKILKSLDDKEGWRYKELLRSGRLHEVLNEGRWKQFFSKGHPII